MLAFRGLGVSSFSEVAAFHSQNGTRTIFTFGESETVRLENVAFTDLVEDNFIFLDDPALIV